jgi:hypothetical protein
VSGAKHTPGRWVTGTDAAFIDPRDTYAVGFPDVVPGARDMDERRSQHEANAALIAAAPTMLDACEAALEARIGAHDIDCRSDRYGDGCDCWVGLAKNAIALAKGGAR